MEQTFWANSWQQGQIGFHEGRPNPNLAKYFDRLGADETSHVLVPLCGKAVDLIWLSERVGHVTGVEFVEQAVHEFFADNELVPERREIGAVTEFRAGNITILRADIFDVGSLPEDGPGDDVLQPIDFIWDRAAMVALPPEMRVRYTATLAQLAPGATLLLNALDYDQEVMAGPPHSVPEAEVRMHYETTLGKHVELLAAVDVVDKMAFRGHSYFTSSCYLISL